MAAPLQVETISVRQLVEQLRHDLGLSDDELAMALAIPVGALHDGGLDTLVQEQHTMRRLHDLSELRGRLSETFAAEGIPRWLRSGNRYLGGQKPIDALLTDRLDRIDAALGALDWGIYI